MKPHSTSWWGRVGEVLYLHLFPTASDAVAEYGNTTPFDAQHPSHGRVNAKTAKEHLTKHGKPAWSFHVGGVAEACDHAFLVGFDQGQEHVVQAWLIPSGELPTRLRVMSPSSKEYEGAPHELDVVEVALLDRKFRAVVEGLGKAPPLSSTEKVGYDRVMMGKVGEAIYGKIHPESDYVAGRNPIETYDFLDPDGTKVNVRIRRWHDRKSGPSRWTFFRSDTSTADVYYFIGVDRAAKEVHACYRIPTNDLPAKGLSVSVTGSTKKWAPYRVLRDLPKPVSDFVDVDDIAALHLEIKGVNADLVAKMTPGEVEALLRRAVSYHRVLGFPYPRIPPDEYLERDMKRLDAYQPDGKNLPVENVGLGLCSAYMPHRFRSRNANADFSSVGAFEDDDRLLRALGFCLRGEKPGLTRTHLRTALTALNRTPVNFRPAVTKALVDVYCPRGGVVFDPCAGWGGRMVGSLMSSRRYVGVEPLDETHARLYQLGMRVCEFLSIDRDHVRLLHGKVQDVDLEGVEADFALTSPPFWTKEVYGDGDRDPRTLVEWRDTFLRPMFGRVASVLRPRARFAVHITDVREGGAVVPLESVAVKDGESCGFRLEDSWRMMKSSFGGQPGGRYDPVLVFRKV